MIVQITLTVHEAKWIIAKGIAALPEVQKALNSGRIFLKGGTTVSAVCQELSGNPLRISGRITPLGTRTAHTTDGGYHSALIHKGKFIGVDDCLPETIESFRNGDVAIIGANAFDRHGNAALMYGAPLGGPPGHIISGLMAEIKTVIIPVGWEKFVPGSIAKIISKTGRKAVSKSIGMAVGLTPLAGQIITETDAITVLADIDCTIIGRGGIEGAEGATTMVIEGTQREVEKIFKLIVNAKGKAVSGTLESLKTCNPPIDKCKTHRGCIYRKVRE